MRHRPALTAPSVWTAPVEAFLAEQAHTRRLSPLTVAAYARELSLLAVGRPVGPADILTADLRRALAQAHAAGLSGRSLARRLSAWRSFFRWLERTGQRTGNPATGLRPPRSARRLPGVLGVDAAVQLVKGTSNAPQEPTGPGAAADPAATGKPALATVQTLTPWQQALQVQDDAMFELLYSSGLRLAELVGLDRARLDLRAGLVTVLGKGSRTRTVPVGQPACAALERWLAQRALLLPADDLDAVFLNRRGLRVAPRTVQDRLARRGRELGLPQRVHPHMLRHSCASHVLQSSADLRAVQELLGHASIASTQIYSHLDFQHLAQAYDAAHPRARKRPSGESS